MPQWPALILAALAALALTMGAVLEHRQRSSGGPVAVVPTLHHAFVAAMLAAFALAVLRIARIPSVAWWHSLLAFTIVLAAGVWLIVAVGNRAEKRRPRETAIR